MSRLDDAIERRDNRVRAQVYRNEAMFLYKMLAKYAKTSTPAADALRALAESYEKAAENYEAKG